MPVRKVSHRSGRNIIGKFPSLKMGRMIAFESSIERDFIYFIEFDQDIVAFEEQPLTIEYQYLEKKHIYYPDFHLIKADGTQILVECKPEEKVEDEEVQRKIRVAEQWCARCNWSFEVVTEEELRSGSKLENIQLLWKYARYVVPPEMSGQIYGALTSNGGKLSLANLAGQVYPDHPYIAFTYIFQLAYTHKLFIPLDQGKINSDSQVSLPIGQIEEEVAT